MSAAPVPQIWPACTHHCVAGYLVGDWFDITEAADIDLVAVHRKGPSVTPMCEEIEIFDVDGLGISKEMGLLEAVEWAEAYERAGAEQWPAVAAWVSTGDYVAEGTGDVPSISDFEDRYCGIWPDLDSYLYEQADDLGLFQGLPDDHVTVRYFNWRSWLDDESSGYCTAPAPEYQVYVFRSL